MLRDFGKISVIYIPRFSELRYYSDYTILTVITNKEFMTFGIIYHEDTHMS